MSNETMKDGERAAFEAWAADRGFPLSSGTVCYANPGTEKAWEGWQARALLTQAPTERMSAAAKIDEQTVIEAVKQWFPDRAYQAPFFAKALFAARKAEIERGEGQS